MIDVTCPRCGHGMRYRDAAAGRVVKCSECDKKLRLPGVDDGSAGSPVEPRRRPAKGDDRRLEARLRLDQVGRSERTEPKHTPEWVLPSILFGIGLVLPIIGGAIELGAIGPAVILLVVVIKLVFTVPLTIGALFIIAPLLGVSFGGFWLAVLRIAAITVFNLGVTTIFDLGGWGWTGYLISLPISYFLFSHFFDLSLNETIYSLVIIGLIQRIVALFIALAILKAVKNKQETSLHHPDGFATPIISATLEAPNWRTASGNASTMRTAAVGS